MRNCPNCGAPIDNYTYVKCQYCGTDYYDFAAIVFDKPFFMKMKLRNNKTMLARVILTEATINQFMGDSIDFPNECQVVGLIRPETSISLDFSVVEDMLSDKPSLRLIENKEEE